MILYLVKNVSSSQSSHNNSSKSSHNSYSRPSSGNNQRPSNQIEQLMQERQQLIVPNQSQHQEHMNSQVQQLDIQPHQSNENANSSQDLSGFYEVISKLNDQIQSLKEENFKLLQQKPNMDEYKFFR